MGPNRIKHRLDGGTPRTQAGITAIGFLILAVLFGVVGLAALKIGPMYMQKMRLDTILTDIQREFSRGARNPADIRLELNKRLAVEGLRLPRESVTITQDTDSYNVRIQSENREPYLGDIYFLVVYDRQVEILR